MLRKFLYSLLIIVGLLGGMYGYSLVRTDFRTDDGVAHRWRDYEGQWVVVNYFALWCAPCLREMPELNQFYLHSDEKTSLFAISFDDVSQDELVDIKRKFDIQFPVITHAEQPLPMVKPNSLPATFIIGPDGEVKKQLLGEQSAASLRSVIDILKTL
ncbi:Thiol-disulfide oxidoreductase ResA [Paraglaciecola mesophila]|uniref:Thiol-disulfide oxidoreductase ResA n=1 Tax=Paraglaciecola mesophila TaxID=197222 RepID=A0A857JF30_9ALTE|nr:TlpA disulfide reductase family protein [Paraglaciecola mesophila]QHJ10619.1 Thiol-disulfide oxidoreductase ResA [Paraglaciecola mesophila]